MRVLGIDCGTENTGYGVIDTDGRRHTFVAAGVVSTSPKEPMYLRLLTISRALRELVGKYAPEAAAVEDVFYAANVKTSLKLAQVRGVALVTIAEAGVRLKEYSALEIKMSVVGYGRAEKQQVQMMVRSLLQLDDDIKSPDAADALAAAICCATHHALEVAR